MTEVKKVFFRDHKNIPKLIVIIVVKLNIILKIELCTLNGGFI